MRLGINTLFLIPGKVGGTETYTRGLVGVLEEIDKKNNYLIFCNQENHDTFRFRSKNFQKILCPIRASFRPWRILWEQLVLPIQAWQNKVDVLLSLGYVCPLFLPCKSVVVIYDLNWFFHPKEFSFLERLAWKTLVSLSARRTAHIITSSENSKKDISEVLKISKNRITVVYGGIDKERFKPVKNEKKISIIKKKYGIKEKFILTVSASYHFKNLERLIDAFYLTSQKFPNLQLLVVGLSGRAKPEILEKIKKYNLKDKVIIAGWVADEDLPPLYSVAEAYVHPSLYEGFGFPVLEAMASGCPVISSNAASLPELVGDAGIIVNARDEKEIAQGIEKILKNSLLVRKLRMRGAKRCQKFSWEVAARGILEIYKELE